MDVDSDGHTYPECTGCGEGWTGGSLPAWADSLLEDTATPSIPGSLSHFFAEMSGGAHILRGRTLSTVVTSDTSIAWYHDNVGEGFNTVSRANRHILEKVASLEDFSTSSPFDLTGDGQGGPDGIVDYIFIYWQSVNTMDGSTFKTLLPDFGGYSSLVTSTLTMGAKEAAPQSGATLLPAVYDPASNFRTVIRHRWQVAALAAHEYGHDLLLVPPGGPLVSGNHICSSSRYGIMQGYTIPGSMMMEGVLRYKLGWIAPPVVEWPTSFPFDTTIALSASYVDHDGCFAILETAEQTTGREQYFMLEARKDSLPGEYYNTPQPADAACCRKTLDVGEGLLITHVRENGLGAWLRDSSKPALADVEVSTGRFDATSHAPDPAAGHTLITADGCNVAHALGNRSGRPADLFQPASPGILSSDAFGPYTNPNSDLYNETPLHGAWQERYSGITIDQIRWTAGGDSIEARIHIEDPDDPPADADTLRADTTWEGLVQLTGDLVVPHGVQLTAEDGARLVLRAGPDGDRFEGGDDPERVEVIVQGTADVRGGGSAGVSFTSSRDDTFTHPVKVTSGGISSVEDYPGEVTDADSGDWYSLRFQDTDPAAEASSIRDADFDYAVFAVEVDSVGCTLYNNRFRNSSVADIWVPRDVRIPADDSWWLRAPMRVVVNDHDPSGGGEDPTRVEILDHGGLWTSRPAGAAPEDSVWFTPTGASPTPGCWAGIAAEYWEAKGSIKDASIGYAVNPVRYTYLTNTATVQHSTLHHYTGIGILDEWSKTSVIGNSLLGSGATETDSGAVAGVKSILSIPRIEDNTIAWHKEHGIKLEWAKVACSNISVEDSVFVTGNTIQGGGEDSNAMTLGTGLAVSWGCPKRHIRIVDNDISDWRERGVDLTQCADTRLACNAIHDNRRGVSHSRDLNQAATEPNRLRANSIIDSYEVNLWLDDATKFKLYNSGATGYAKENSFMPDSADAGALKANINQQDAFNVLDTQATFWRSGSGQALGTDPSFWSADSAYLAARVTGYPANVSITNPLEEATELCQVGGGGAQQGAGSRELAADEPARSTVRLSARVDQRALDRTVFVLDTSGFVGRARVRVFDVRGRLVAVPFEDEALAIGHHEIAWNRRDMTGMPVASGVYFVRLETAIGSSTGKVVVVR